MQLVALSADGRVRVPVGSTDQAGLARLPAGPLEVVLRPERGGIAVVALPIGSAVARLGRADAVEYRPVLDRLAAHGAAGSCIAAVTTTSGGLRALTLRLAPAATCLPGNSAAGLTLLPPAKAVTVTREEDHQDVLARRRGRVIAELVPAPITAGTHAGQDGIEVRIDGRRVGELTRRMAQRYGPQVAAITTRGGRAGCEALVRHGERGAQVELRLPAEDAESPDLTEPLRPPGATAGAPPPPWTAPPVVAPPWTAPPVAAPSWTAPPATPGVPAWPEPRVIPTPARKPRRWLPLAAAGCVVLVLGLAVGTGSSDDGRPTTPAAATRTTVAAAPRAPATTLAPPPSAAAAPTTASAAAPAPAPAAVRTTPPAPAPRPEPTRAPRTTEEPAPAAGCDPNYTGCVPIASDVDCAGGSGNGPAYVAGPVRVIGSDVYGLDRDGNGVGCE